MENYKSFRQNLVFLLFLIIASSCSKNSSGDEEVTPVVKQNDIAVIDEKVEAWMKKFNMPGSSLAISKNGKLVYMKGYGERNTQTKEKVTPETQFRVASVSKLFTSVAMMKLIQEKRILMNQKVFGFNGAVGNKYGQQTPSGIISYKKYVEDITVSDLLHHTLGGWGQENDPAFFDAKMSRDEIINWTVNNIDLKTKPGTSFSYSNMGYILCAAIIERITGESYSNYVNKVMWSEMGLKNTKIAGSSLSDRLPLEANYYAQGQDAPYVYTMNLARGDAAMGWLSTPKDLLKFATAVDGAITRPDFLNPETIQTMITPTAASKGFGFTFGCGWVVEKDEWFWWGTLPGTFAILYRNGNGVCIAATANSRFTSDVTTLNEFIGVINFIAPSKDIPWQDIDQF